MAGIIDFGAFQIRFLQDRHGTGGSLDLFELLLSPEGRMPVPHYHESWEETVYGLSGTVTYIVEGQGREIGPGQSLFIPRGQVHGFENRSGAPARCLCLLTPGVIGPEYFTEMAALMAGGRPDPARAREVMLRYGLIPAPQGGPGT
jgi:quercetin dioxygenase-like cupin family protein